MEESIQYYDLSLKILSSSTVLISLLFAVQLYFVKNFNHSANKTLSRFFIAFIVIQLFQFAFDLKLNDFAMSLLILFTPAALSLAPTAYLYTSDLTGTKHRFTEITNHYILSAIFLAINLLLFGCFLTIKTTNPDSEMTKPISQLLLWSNLIGLVGIFLFQNVYYIRKAFQQINEHQNRIKNLFSYEEGIKLNWVKNFIYGYLIFAVLAYVSNIPALSKVDWLFDALVLIYLIYVGFSGSRQIDIYVGMRNSDSVMEANVQEKEETDNQIDSNRIIELKQQIEKLVLHEKLYLNHELSILDIAKALDSNTKYVSEAVNQGFGKNFISYINEYRIEEAKKLLKDKTNDNLTLEAIGQKAGFKSKSTFNNSFKRLVGCTPSEFKRK